MIAFAEAITEKQSFTLSSEEEEKLMAQKVKGWTVIFSNSNEIVFRTALQYLLTEEAHHMKGIQVHLRIRPAVRAHTHIQRCGLLPLLLPISPGTCSGPKPYTNLHHACISCRYPHHRCHILMEQHKAFRYQACHPIRRTV